MSVVFMVPQLLDRLSFTFDVDLGDVFIPTQVKLVDLTGDLTILVLFVLLLKDVVKWSSKAVNLKHSSHGV